LKLSLQATMLIGIIFAVACLGVAVTGFASLGEISDATQAADARGFAWFWAFLALVAMTFAVLSWWLARTQGKDGDA
jgi:hypothetical protein